MWEQPYKTLTFVPKENGGFVDVQQLQEVVAVVQPLDFKSKQLDRNPFVVLSQPACLIHKNGLFLLANGMIASGKQMEDMTLRYFGQDLVAEITRACINRNYEEVEEEYHDGDHHQRTTNWHFGEDGRRSSSSFGIRRTDDDDDDSSRSNSIKRMKKSNVKKLDDDNNPFFCDISSISSSSVNRKTQHEVEGISSIGEIICSIIITIVYIFCVITLILNKWMLYFVILLLWYIILVLLLSIFVNNILFYDNNN